LGVGQARSRQSHIWQRKIL